MDEWVNVFGFSIDNLPGQNEATIKYSLPQHIKLAVVDDYEVFVGFRCKWPKLSIVQNKAGIKQTPYIAIEPIQELSFEQLLNIEFRISTFFELAIAKHVGPKAISAWTEEKKQVDIFFKLLDIPVQSDCLLPRDMLFTFADTHGLLPTPLENWLAKAERLAPAYSLYTAIVENPRMYLEQRFLSLAQAVESFHRRSRKNCVLPKSEHKQKINRIINAVPEDDKYWLQTKLAYSNEPTLFNRLEELCDEFSAVLDGLIPDTALFRRKVRDTRNYYTHYDEKLKKKAAMGQELFNLTQKLKMLLELCFLKEVGFDEITMKRLIERNRRYQAEASVLLLG